MLNSPQIIYEDDLLIILDKPSGIPSVLSAHGRLDTLSSRIIGHFPEQRLLPKGDTEAGLVHRLDNDTSGIIIAARTKDAYDKLRRQFSQGTVQKGYLALVIGNPPEEGEINTPIAHHPRKKKKMIVCQGKTQCLELKARPALTLFRTEGRYEFRLESTSVAYALLSIAIGSGVRHQIRSHLASIGYPLAGDLLYQNPKTRAADVMGLTNHFLHANHIAFFHPLDGREVEFNSDLPPELQKIISKLHPIRR